MLKTVDIEITGIQPLLAHRFTDEAAQAKPTRRIKASDVIDTYEEAKRAANIEPDTGHHYLSAFSIINAIGAAGASHKMVGSRKSVRFIIPSAVRWPPTEPILKILIKGKPTTDFVVDARPVTIPSTKGRIMRYRPRYEGWTMRFQLLVETDLISTELVHQLLGEAGVQIGIGDFRPEKRGPFGSFRVTRFEEVENTDELDEVPPSVAAE
jgi:hypothetical protein